MWANTTLSLAFLFVIGGSAIAADNRHQIRHDVESKFDKVIWGKEIDHLEWAKCAASFAGGPGVVALYLEELAKDILRETGKAVAKETLFDLLRGKKESTIIGGRPVYVSVATYNHWTIEKYPMIDRGVPKTGRLRVKRPNTHQFYVAIGKKQFPRTEVPSVAEIGPRFRAVNDWSVRNGFEAGFPNFHEAISNGVHVYGTMLFVPDAVEWRDIPRVELGPLDSDSGRFSSVHDWATKKGFRGGYPNYHEGEYGGTKVIGVFLVHQQFADFKDVPAKSLGNPGTFEARMRAVNDWAVKNGYSAGFPTGHEASPDGKKVFGCILMKKNATVHRDIPVTDLLSTAR